jgi:hypothetical protein
MNRTDLDSNRAFRGAVAAIIATAALNGTAGVAQALAGPEETADAITGTAEPANVTGPAETATGPAERAGAATGPDQAGSIVAPAPFTPANTTSTPSSGTTDVTTPFTRLTATTAVATALSPAPARPATTAWTQGVPVSPIWTRGRQGRPIWTRAGLAGMAGGLTAAAKAKPTKARPTRKTPYRVHRGVWRTSAHPKVRVWAPKTPKGRNKAIAYRLITQRSWPVTQFRCLDSLWTRESNWNHRAQNPSSGAYGIPQALPGAKMVGVGHDWRVNPATQIRWGLKYIKGRYGSPCGAWGHFQSHNWY